MRKPDKKTGVQATDTTFDPVESFSSALFPVCVRRGFRDSFGVFQEADDQRQPIFITISWGKSRIKNQYMGYPVDQKAMVRPIAML